MPRGLSKHNKRLNAMSNKNYNSQMNQATQQNSNVTESKELLFSSRYEKKSKPFATPTGKTLPRKKNRTRNKYQFK